MHFVDDYLNHSLPQIKVYRPQASFLLWRDCRELNLPQKELVRLFEDKAALALNDGMMFGKEGEGYMRMNLGCPRALLAKAVEKLKVESGKWRVKDK